MKARELEIVAAALLLVLAGAWSDAVAWEHVPSPTLADGGFLYGVDGATADDVWAVGFTKDLYNQYSYDSLSLILRWDGSSWQPVPSPSPGVYQGGGTDVVLYDVAAVSTTDVWAVGTWFTTHPDDGFLGFQSFALHWDGSSWVQVDTPITPAGGTGATLVDLEVVGPDDVWAVGHRVAPELPGVSTIGLVLHWDGASWTELPTPPVVSPRHHHLRGIVFLAPDNVVVVGGHSGDGYGAPDHPYVARWDGSSWTLVDDVPSPGVQTFLRRVAIAAPGRLWVVGQSNNGDGTTRPLVLSWESGSWTDVPVAGYDHPYGDLRDIVVTGADEAWAVGSWLAEPAPALARPLVLRWDGIDWRQEATDPAGPESGSFFGTAAPGGASAWSVGVAAGDLTHIQRSGSIGETFADGFDSGSLDAWSAAVPAP